MNNNFEKEGIFTISMPTPFPQVEDIRAYVIDAGDDLIMVDTGVKTPQAREVLISFFEEKGFSFSDVKRIFITHHHIDHSGNAKFITDHSKGLIYIDPFESARIMKGMAKSLYEKSRGVYESFFRKVGMPENVFAFLDFFERRFDEYLDFLPPDRIFYTENENEYRIGNLTFKAINFPGHTKGMTNFLIIEKGIMFSGDHIIKNITPNALLDLDENGQSRKSLLEYLDSLEKTKMLKIKVALSGHGEPVEDIDEHISKLFRFYERRKERILRVLKKEGRARLYDLTMKVFPMVRIYDLFLAISEVLGILEVLESDGFVLKYEEGEFEFWEPADSD